MDFYEMSDVGYIKAKDFKLEYALKTFNYDPISGVVRWSEGMGKRLAGRIVGSIGRSGYRMVTHYNKRFVVSRLCWLLYYGVKADGLIDHLDGDKSNNSIVNLREISHSGNAENLHKGHKDNSSGFLGVYKVKGKDLWCSQLFSNKKRVHLEYSKSPKEAHEKYIAAKLLYHVSYNSEKV